ncbi:MAG: AhpC/TSA family protein [Candidatus Dormibacteraceae bacterium]
MRGVKSEIEAAGARLVFIGNGDTASARHFKATQVPDCEVLTDPSTASYALLGAYRGIWTTLTPRSLPASLRALRRGFRQSRTQGHAYLLGGVAIVDSSGVVRWSFVSRFAGDHPPPAKIVATLRRVMGKFAAAEHQPPPNP